MCRWSAAGGCHPIDRPLIRYDDIRTAKSASCFTNTSRSIFPRNITLVRAGITAKTHGEGGRCGTVPIGLSLIGLDSSDLPVYEGNNQKAKQHEQQHLSSIQDRLRGLPEMENRRTVSEHADDDGRD